MSLRPNKKFSTAYYHHMLFRITVIMTVIMLSLTIVLYIFLNHAVQKNMRNTEQGIVQNTCAHVYDYLEQLSYISAYFSTFQRNVPLEQLNHEAYFWLRKSINDSISSYITNHDYIENIYVKINDLAFNDVKLQEPAAQPIETFMYNHISYSKNADWPYNLFFSNTANGNPVFNDVVIEVSSVRLGKKILNSESSRFEYLVDGNGTVLAAASSENLGKNILSLYHMQKEDLNKSYFEQSIKDEKYNITIQRIKKTSLRVVSFSPKSIYAALINTALLETVSIGLVLQIVTIISCYAIVTKIYKPIRDITQTFQYHFPDNTEKFLNEIEYINATLQKTITLNKSMEEELPKAIQKLHQAQASALQSQINPHFLYNTLENIKVISVNLLDIDNPVERSLVLLNNILCESMKQTTLIVPLSHEIRLVNSYIELMQMRYKHNFDVSWLIDKTVTDCYILKFLLQPMIENSIIHGFTNTNNNQKITIDIRRQSNDLNIIISDNGAGIPADELKKIKHDLQNTDNVANCHIGIQNVHLRIQLLYGKTYGVQIESDGNGTVCTLHLPAEQPQSFGKTI